MPLTEKVLVIPRKNIDPILLGQGFTACQAANLEMLLHSKELSFLSREIAETNPQFKQLIPYVVIHCNKKVAHYQRGKASSEGRLRSKRSLGIGGHIQAEDTESQSSHYEQGLWRELSEEVGISRRSPSPIVLGTINDDSNEVGSVHLGIVHLLELPTEDLWSHEKQLQDLKFSCITELEKELESFETWSQLLMPHLAAHLPM